MLKKLILFVLLQPWLLVAADKSAEPEPWFQHSLVGMEVGPTGAQFSNSDTNDAPILFPIQWAGGGAPMCGGRLRVRGDLGA